MLTEHEISECKREKIEQKFRKTTPNIYIQTFAKKTKKKKTTLESSLATVVANSLLSILCHPHVFDVFLSFYFLFSGNLWYRSSLEMVNATTNSELTRVNLRINCTVERWKKINLPQVNLPLSQVPISNCKSVKLVFMFLDGFGVSPI